MVKLIRIIAIAIISVLLAVNVQLTSSSASVIKKKVAITFDYETFKERPVGGNNIMPHILDVLDKYGIKATFFSTGRTIEDYPDIIKEIQRRGHQIGYHAYAHEVMTELSSGQQRVVFENYLKVMNKTGIKFTGFRGPHYEANGVTLKLAKEFGLCYDSTLWKGYKLKPELKEIDVLGPDDWWWYYGKNHTSQKEFAEELEKVYLKYEEPIVVVLHPHIEETKDPRLVALDALLAYLKSKGAVFMTLGDDCK